jgi:hypothetical protein
VLAICGPPGPLLPQTSWLNGDPLWLSWPVRLRDPFGSPHPGHPVSAEVARAAPVADSFSFARRGCLLVLGRWRAGAELLTGARCMHGCLRRCWLSCPRRSWGDCGLLAYATTRLALYSCHLPAMRRADDGAPNAVRFDLSGGQNSPRGRGLVANMAVRRRFGRQVVWPAFLIGGRDALHRSSIGLQRLGSYVHAGHSSRADSALVPPFKSGGSWSV